MNNDKSYARCKACNTSFYPSWNKKAGAFEELCWKCLPISIRAARTDCDLYRTSTSRWSEDSDLNFLQGFFEGKEVSPFENLLEEDPYYEYGEEALGGLDLFDKYT